MLATGLGHHLTNTTVATDNTGQAPWRAGVPVPRRSGRRSIAAGGRATLATGSRGAQVTG